MRIRRLSAKNFGKFEDYTVDFESNLSVINGRNEAGKSTIFDMIKILLFGLGEDSSPAERLRFIRHGAGEAYISGEFERSDGTPISLSRKITETGSYLNVNENFNFNNLGNVAAPPVAHLTKEVYENIYALDFHTMSQIRDDVWQGIKEEFMGADMAKELVSASDALQSAQNKAGRIYAQDNSPSVLSELNKERDILDKNLNTVQQSQQSASNSYLDLEKTNREIADMQNQIEFENAFLTEADKMNNLKSDIARIRSLAQSAGDLSPYKKWLPNIKEEYSKLKNEAFSTKELFEQAQMISSPQDTYEEEIPYEEFDEKLAKVLENKEKIEALEYEKPDYQNTEQDHYLKEEYESARGHWHTLLRENLAIDANEETTKVALLEINHATLSDKLNEYLEKRNAINNMMKQSNEPIKKGVRTVFFVISLLVSILAIALGVSMFFFDFLSDFLSPIVITHYWFDMTTSLVEMVSLTRLIFATLLCGLGLIFLIISFVFIKGKSKKKVFHERDEKIKYEKDIVEQLRQNFENELCGLDFPKLRLKKPEPQILNDITELKKAKIVLQDAERKLAEFEKNNYQTQNFNEAAGKNTEKIDSLATLLLDLPSESAEENLIALKKLLKTAEEAKAEYDYVQANRPQKSEPLEYSCTPESENQLICELEAKSKEAMAKYQQMVILFGENEDEKIEEIQQRYDMLNKAVVLRDEIISKHSDFKEVTERLAQLEQGGWPYTEKAVGEAKGRIEQLRFGINEVQSRVGLMENNVKQAILGEKPSDIASEIIRLAEKIKQSETNHDQYRISEQIIKLGNDIFSKLHQPEVLSRAGYYLSILTDGKYSEMKLSEDTSSIMVLTELGEFMTPHLARLSQATCEQIYLSIRLSVIESFDANSEIMPITLDEALITWDTERLTAGLDLIAQIARKRQVLIFTCHDFIVNIVRENQPEAQIIEI